MKTRFIGYVVSSIDGRIAEVNNSNVDWNSKEDSNFYQNSLKKVDAVIVGHNTFKLASKRNWKDAIVLTSKIKKIQKIEKNTFLNPQISNIKKIIKARKYNKIAVIGGSAVYNYCLRNNLLEEIFVTIEPYVFTNGICMFSGDKFKKYSFALMSMKKLNTKGTLLLHYKIIK